MEVLLKGEIMQNLNILILDDEKRITEELAEFLQRKKFTVFEANEVQNAFRLSNDCKIDILILDIALNNANGLDVLREVKEQFPEIEILKKAFLVYHHFDNAI